MMEIIIVIKGTTFVVCTFTKSSIKHVKMDLKWNVS